MTFLPHVEKLFETYPDLELHIKRVLYDSACDDKKLKEIFWERFRIELKASLNPRRKKTITTNLIRGIEKITPYGDVICMAGYKMDYLGIRYENGK